MPSTAIPATPEFLTWQDVDRLVDHLVPQLRGPYDALLMITRGGIVPGGLIANALDLRYIVTAAVEFPTTGESRLAWPNFLQFPSDALLRGKHILIVDDIWVNGRTITSVRGRVQSAGGAPETAVLHFKPGSSLFRQTGPDHYAALTDRVIIYPWETQRGPSLPHSERPQHN